MVNDDHEITEGTRLDAMQSVEMNQNTHRQLQRNLAQLQARGLKFNQDAYVRSQATTLAYEIIDRMRANRDQASAYAVPDPGGNCTPATSTPSMDLTCWYDRIEETLPDLPEIRHLVAFIRSSDRGISK